MGPSLTDKRVLVTGAGSGIGAATALAFAEAGARVAVADRELAACLPVQERLAGEGHIALGFDVSSASSVAEAFAEVDGGFDGLDAVVNCAGIWRPGSDGPLAEVADETWDEIIAVNLTGTFYVAREAVKRLPSGGSLVTVGSVAALTGWDKLNAYSASKGGVVSFSRALAIECAPKGIRVNCICPGVIETPMTAEVLAYSRPKVLPLKRLGQPDDIARVALFLCSDWASFMTATVIAVDGGFSAA